MEYFDWHDEPGYFRDVTRHFPPQATLLDVGCGIGWLGRHFSNYTGIDISPAAVEAAVREGRNVVLGDADESLPFDDASFDAVVLKDVLEHVDEPIRLVRDVHRVLSSGGRVFASSPDAQRWVWDDYTHRRPFTRKSLRLLFRDAGFSVQTVRYESVVPGTSIISGWMANRRRPAPLRAAAWLPLVRRNVWLTAVRP